MASLVSSTLTSGFIDLATFDEIEKYMYGGKNAVTYFVRETRKSTWFTQVPTVLSRGSGTAQFNQEWSANITRAGDYLLQVWLRVDLPSVTLAAGNQFGANGRLRWTRNLMHNLIREAQVTFNDLSAARLDNYHLDFWAAFTVPANKQIGYDNMIGNIADLTQPSAPTVAKRGFTLNLPLPFFFTRDTGVSLPTAALPYNEMRINVWFRDWNQLLIIDDIAAAPGTNPSSPALVTDLVGGAPLLGNVYIWANYAIVSNDERKRMGCAPRDILIEQVQTAPIQTYTPATNAQPSFDIRFAHAIKVLFFAVRNTTNAAEYRSRRCCRQLCSSLPLCGRPHLADLSHL
jgi:Major capsid protein N-terminus/Large eukaryotic DNA virus major capsid protein